MMQESFHQSQDQFNDTHESDMGLWQYLQSLSPEMIAQLSKPHSNEVSQVMERNILGLLGNLPSENFDVAIQTNREHLGRLLASAMMSGYFLRNAEQRMGFEQMMLKTDTSLAGNAATDNTSAEPTSR